MLKNPAEPGEAPEDRKANWHSPKHKRSPVSTRARWCSHLSRVGLARPGIKRSRLSASSLLIEDGGSHDVGRSALVALVKIQLRYGCHSVSPDLATPCDTGPSD